MEQWWIEKYCFKKQGAGSLNLEANRITSFKIELISTTNLTGFQNLLGFFFDPEEEGAEYYL